MDTPHFRQEMISLNAGKKEVLAIIPARGGSKGIPRKNIVDLCGKPLIAYSIEAALKASTVSRVIVSTDDPEIASISRGLGAEVPFLRPADLADDHSDVGGAIDYTLARMREEEAYAPDALVQLYPTHPFRPPQFLDWLTGILLKGYRKVVTVKSVSLPDTPLIYRDQSDHAAATFVPQDSNGSNPMFRPYGLYYGTSLTPFAPLNIYLHPVSDPISLIDIDDWEDLYYANEVLANNLFSFEMQ